MSKKLIRCRYPAGRGLAPRYFDEYLGREGARDMEMQAQRRGDREGENAGLKYARGHERAMELVKAEMNPSEREIAKQALKCYQRGGMVLWDRK